MSVEERLRGLEQYQELLRHVLTLYPNAAKFNVPVTLPSHDAVTLSTAADTLLGLTGQQVTLDTQTANKVLAGPTTGAAAAPTFRALVAADLPVLHWVYPNMAEWVANGGTANTPLTSTAWFLNAHSTEAKTLIDLSTVFGAPAGIKAVSVRMIARDSGSSAATCFFVVSSDNVAGHSSVEVYRDKVTNDALDSKEGVCPCDANGDIYYQIAASGTGTLDAWLEIVGYYI